MIRSPWLGKQLHVCFFGRTVPFAIVATHTCGDKIIPSVLSASAARNDMVKCYIRCFFTAILATVVITFENILTRQVYFFVWNADIREQFNNARIWIAPTYGTNHASPFLGDKFGFHHEEQQKSFFGRADTDGFVALIENKDFSA